MSDIFLSIIIPVYNEERRIHKAFSQLATFLTKHPFKTEIIFVNDGSSDSSRLKVESSKLEFKKKYKTKIHIISYQPNRGKGYALKQGVRKAAGKWILCIDADMSIPLSEFEKFLPKLNNNQILVGVRNEKSRVKAQQGFARRLLSRGFRMISFFLTGVSANDITCGLKCFEGKIAKKLFGKLQTHRWAYDTELFMQARKENIRILEISIDWTEDEGTTIKVLPAMVKSLIDLIRMRIRF